MVVFGGFAMIKYARWAEALNQINIKSVTLVPSILHINSRGDWDKIWLDFAPSWIPGRSLRRILAPALAWFWVLRNARVICTPVGGISFFTWVGLDRLELWLLRKKGIHTVAICGGGDAYALGSMRDPSLRHALQSSYPDRARIHRQIAKKVRIWEERADVFMADKMVVDGIARSDVITPYCAAVNVSLTTPAMETLFDGQNGEVRILHVPNHRYFKGTEFLIRAVQNLQQEGLRVNLRILERTQNKVVLEQIEASDIVVDQLIISGYGTFALEAMSLGRAVICNLENRDFYNLFARYSFLAECPVVSASPENIELVLRSLVSDPIRRSELGVKGNLYAKKWHSYEAWQELWQMFESLNFDGNEIVKRNFYHPLQTTKYSERIIK